jgi:hypothetical protein
MQVDDFFNTLNNFKTKLSQENTRENSQNESINDYEKKRVENMKRNKEFFTELFPSKTIQKTKEKKIGTKKRNLISKNRKQDSDQEDKGLQTSEEEKEIRRIKKEKETKKRKIQESDDEIPIEDSEEEKVKKKSKKKQNLEKIKSSEDKKEKPKKPSKKKQKVLKDDEDIFGNEDPVVEMSFIDTNDEEIRKKPSKPKEKGEKLMFEGLHFYFFEGTNLRQSRCEILKEKVLENGNQFHSNL